MPTMASTNMVMFDMGTYWVFSILFLTILDSYAGKKLGGKNMIGYKILRMPRFFSLIFLSLYTIIVFGMVMLGVQIPDYILTFLGVPYFATWMFFLVNVLRRIRAENGGRTRTL